MHYFSPDVKNSLTIEATKYNKPPSFYVKELLKFWINGLANILFYQYFCMQ